LSQESGRGVKVKMRDGTKAARPAAPVAGWAIGESIAAAGPFARIARFAGLM
jgi:hypothetical protein